MASKKTITTLRDKSVDELRNRERDLQEQLFKLRFQRATGRVENPMKMRQVRREIAQIETLLNEAPRSTERVREAQRWQRDKNEQTQALTAPQNARTKVGVVVSNKMQKTVVVAVENLVKHGMYQKYIKRTNKFLAHNEQPDINVGDRVVIEETRPLSKRKRWNVREVVSAPSAQLRRSRQS